MSTKALAKLRKARSGGGFSITQNTLTPWIDQERSPVTSEMVNAGMLALRDTADEMIDYSAGRIQKNDSVFRGTLLNSGSVKETRKGYDVFYKADHAADVEEGSRPHWIPYTAIYSKLGPWAQKKLGDAKAAFALYYKIGTKGTRAKPFWRPTLARFDGMWRKHKRRRLKEVGK